MGKAFETGVYRNLFAEYGYDEAAIENRMQAIWHTIFFDENEKFYFEVGDDMGFVTDTGNNDVRSEGQSYAMMAAVQMNDKDIFDRVWKWTKTYMWLDAGIHAGYFAWSVALDGTKLSDGPAPDGEEFMAMALFFASHRWGDGDGIFNYSQQARDILHCCLHNPQPMWHPEHKLIKFVPGLEFSDPSYHVAHFYELFALWANESDRPFWQDAAVASREYLAKACHPVTGLNPEYANYDGTPNREWRDGFHMFFSDAYRVALNIGLDDVWFGRNVELSQAMERQQRFFAETNPGELNNFTYEIDGTRNERPVLHPVGLIATNAAASLATTGENARFMVEKFWNTPLRTGERRYYDNFLYLFCYMALSGNYRIYKEAF